MNSVVEPSVKKQHGRASPLLPLLGWRPHIVVLFLASVQTQALIYMRIHSPHVVVLSGMNDKKCDLERKTRLVGRSRGIHINKYKS